METTPPSLSNSQADLADKASDAWQRHRRAGREAHAAYLEAGARLLEAKAACQHGEFGAVLARAGIPRRTAARAMKIAKHRIKMVTVTYLGGIRRTLEALAIFDRSNPRPMLAWLIRLKRLCDREDAAEREHRKARRRRLGV